MSGILSMPDGPIGINAWWMRTSLDQDPDSDAFRCAISPVPANECIPLI